ncbi:conjugal transfer protein TraF [bacterium]|nr:conjugal transfer protein TraF [bacterium]
MYFTKTTLFLFVIAILTASIPVYGQPLHSGYMSIAAMGMGGAFTTYSRDATMTLTNPALLNRTGFHLTIISVPASIGNEAKDIFDFFDNNADSLSNLSNLSEPGQQQLSDEIRPFDDKWVNLGANPFLGFTLPGSKLGLAIYSNIVAAVKVDQGVMIPAAGLKGYVDAGVSIGKGFTVMDWESGLAIRYYQRASLSPKRVSAKDMNSTKDIANEWKSELTDIESGIGLDAGVIRSISEKTDVAVTVQDLVGIRDGWVKPNLITGIAYKPAENLILCADMNDWFNTQGVAFFQKLDMGAEYRLPFYKRWLGGIGLRAGVHQGYPTFGFGLKALIFNLNYAYFGMEGGNKPGQIMEYSHRLGVSLTFD